MYCESRMKANFQRRDQGLHDSDGAMSEGERKQVFLEDLKSGGDADSNPIRGIFKSL